MKKNTIAIILLLATLNITKVFGQTNSNQNQYDPSIKNVPTSPEVALLGRFGEIPVGHYTGTANVSVPLYNLKVDNVEIPLALNYHTSGIKVADEATWVGLGWNFLPEGTITQEIRGKEDWITGGDGFSGATDYNIFKNNFPTLYSENQSYRLQVGYHDYNSVNFVVTNPNNNDSFEIINQLKEKKGQPDVFTYNFYGYSGKFFYNPENNNELLFLESNNDVKFTRNTEGWLATTNKGDKFYFYAIEKSKTNQTDYIDIGYTFKITKIELASGKIINFTYQDESTYQEYPIQVARLTNFTGSPSVNTSINATINEKKTLIGIETEDTKIEFNLENREDIRPQFPTVPIKRLGSIDIKSKHSNKKIKSFVFNCSYFNPATSTLEEGYKNKRLKLNSIQELGYDQAGNSVQNTPPYSFEYDTTYNMPYKTSNSDFYGYYNGTTSTTLLPDLAFFDYLNKTPYKNYGLNVTYPYNGAMRYTNTDYITTNILKKVSYPTGGHTAFEYESNTFSNQFIPTQQQVQSANKDTSLTHRGASTVPGGYYFLKSAPFKLPQTTKIKFTNTIYDGYIGPNYPETHYPYNMMLDSEITFYKRKMVNGQWAQSIVKQWKINVTSSVFEQTHQQVWDEEVEVIYDNDPTTEYYVYVENPIQYNSNDGSHHAVVSSRFRYYDDSSIDKSFSFGSGVRIKSIKNYENSTLLSHKQYNYNGGKLIYKFEPLNLIKEATHKSQPTTQTGGCYLESLAIFNDLSVNSNDFGISGSKPFGYNEVVEKDINVINGTEKGYTKYYFTNNEPTGTSLKGIPKVEIPANGENTLIETFNQSQNKISSKVNIYETLPNTYGIYPSFYMINTSTGPVDPSNQSYPILAQGCTVNGTTSDIVIGQSYTGHTYSNAAPTTKYNFIFSPLITGKRRLKTTIDTSFFGSNSLIEKTEFTYTDSGNIDVSKTTTTDGKIIYTDYDYAYDIGNNHLLNRGMTGVPLNIEVTSNGKVLSNIETKYSNTSNYLPSSVVSRNLQTNNWDTEVTYDKYDNKGNLLQYTSKSGTHVAIIWGYNNTQPIAKVEGSTYDQLINTGLVSTIVSASNADASNPANEGALITALDNFRNNTSLSGYQISTYTYDPLIGVTSITPPSGVREVYSYDTANRLEKIVDTNGKVLKEFKYNYKN